MIQKMSGLIIDVNNGEIISGYVRYKRLYFGNGLDILRKNEFELIPIEKNLELRVKNPDGFISKSGNFVREAILRMGKRAYFLEDSPIIKDISRATRCYENGSEFYLTKEEVFYAKVIPIPIEDEIGLDSLLYKAVFGHKENEAVEKYWSDNHIRRLSIYKGPSDTKPYVRQLIFLGTGAKCSLMAVPFGNYDILRGYKINSLPKQ